MYLTLYQKKAKMSKEKGRDEIPQPDTLLAASFSCLAGVVDSQTQSNEYAHKPEHGLGRFAHGLLLFTHW